MSLQLLTGMSYPSWHSPRSCRYRAHLSAKQTSARVKSVAPPRSRNSTVPAILVSSVSEVLWGTVGVLEGHACRLSFSSGYLTGHCKNAQLWFQLRHKSHAGTSRTTAVLEISCGDVVGMESSLHGECEQTVGLGRN
jgi:hypothetical protein